MYVYMETVTKDARFFTVGFFDPEGNWISDSNHTDREDAARRVHWLNGGAALGKWED